MKKSILAFVILICIAFTSTAQKEKNKPQKPAFTVEQESTLAVKKLTILLDLTESQQKKMYPLLLVKITHKQEMLSKRKANKAQMTQLSNDELYKVMIERMDQQILYQKRVKEVLSKNQYEAWHKMQAYKLKEQNYRKTASKKGAQKGKKGHA